MDVLKHLFEKHFGRSVERVLPLQGQLGGSGRTILRLSSRDLSAVGILHSVPEENRAFLGFSRHFRRHGLPVAEIYAEDLSHGAYLEQDLGETTLFEFLSNNRDGGNIHRKKVSESQPGRPPQEVRRQTRNPFPYIRIRTLSQIKEAPRGCGRRTAVDWSATCQSKKSRMDCQKSRGAE